MKKVYKNFVKTPNRKFKVFGTSALALFMACTGLFVFTPFIGSYVPQSASTGEQVINESISGESYATSPTDPVIYTTEEGFQVRRSNAGTNYINHNGSRYDVVAQGAYTPVEYIQSSGTQYIDTQYVNTNATNFEILGEFTSKKGGQYMGARLASANRAYLFGVNDGGTYFAFGWVDKVADTTKAVDTERHTWKKTGDTFSVDTTTATYTATSNNTLSAWLFATNYLTNSDKFYCHFKMYSCKLWDNGTLARDYIPVKNINGTAGLFDRVENKFYGSCTTTQFTAGPEISYTSIEYVESTGAQYFDTGVVLNDSVDYEIKGNFTNTTDVQYMGALSGTSGTPGQRAYLIGSTSSANFPYGWGSTFSYYTKAKDTAVHTWKKEGQSSTLDDGTAITLPSTSNTLTGTLFAARASNGIIWHCSFKMYYCKMWQDGVLIRDYVPAKMHGQVGMFDRVECKFYTSETSTSFNAPAEQTYTELSYIEANGSQKFNTLFIPDNNSKIEMVLSITATNNQNFFCTRGSDYTVQAFTCFYLGNNRFQSDYGNNSQSPSIVLNIGEVYNITRDKHILKVDNSIFSTNPEQTFIGGSYMWIGDSQYNNVPNNANCGRAKYYSIKIWDNGVLVRDYIPAKNSSNVAGFYDKISHSFFQSDGTKAYVAGANLTTTTAYNNDLSPAGNAIANETKRDTRKLSPIAGISINDSIPVGHLLCQKADGTQVLIRL